MNRKRVLTVGFIVFGIVFLVATVMFVVNLVKERKEKNTIENQQEILNEYKEENIMTDEAKVDENSSLAMLPEYKKLYEENSDIIGWLKIEDTKIDYPVMQTMDDEEYYIYRDFYKNDNQNGTLFMDTDSMVGVGKQELNYEEGNVPSTNLIIYGHTMKTGEMFGDLDLYDKEDYGMAHKIIYFDTLYEKREYELISVFYSQVFYKHQDVFKYYKFFQANTQEEFDNWYNNIKEMSIYDTGVTAQFGDEFITLSCCAYHVEDGRFVVVGKRIK